MNYLVVRLFHDLVRSPLKDISDTMFFGCTYMCLGPEIERSGLHLSGGPRENVGNEFLPPSSLDFVNFFVYIYLKKNII